MAYLCIDIGGTKTLVCRVSDDGEIETRAKFPTPQDYQEFKLELSQQIAETKIDDIKIVCAGAPGRVDHESGAMVAFGNLPWIDVPLRTDIEFITGLNTVIENDAKLAGLSEAVLISDQYNRILYVTVSTGIGLGLVTDGRIDHSVADGGGHNMLFEYKGQLVPWETFASGKAIFEEFHQKASEIEDPVIWKEVSRRLAIGFIELITLTSPEIIVLGGGVGTHFHKFKDYLMNELHKSESLLLPVPEVIQASRPEDAVIYGCYELGKSTYGNPVQTPPA